MCLAIPGQIASIEPGGSILRMAQVNFGGIVREVSLAYTPEAQNGDYVIVHAGFAISQLDEAEAQRTWDALDQIGALEELAAAQSGEEQP